MALRVIQGNIARAEKYCTSRRRVQYFYSESNISLYHSKIRHPIFIIIIFITLIFKKIRRKYQHNTIVNFKKILDWVSLYHIVQYSF